METAQNNRLSNFEFIRIVAMFLILIFHYAIHGLLPAVGTKTIAAKFLTLYLCTIGPIGVVLFVLLTGYFMIDKKINLKHFFSIAIETIFYSYVILIISSLFCKDYIVLTPKLIYKSIFPILTGHYWFVTAYLVLYLTIPLINKLFDVLDKTTLKKYLLLFMLIWFVIPLFGYNIKLGSSSLTFFICLYYIGAYIKRYGMPFFENKRNAIIAIILCQGISCLYEIPYMIIHYYNENFIKHLSSYHSILTVITAIFIFMLMKKINIKYNPVINYFSSSAFGVYLLTENMITREVLWIDIFHCNYSSGILYLFFNMMFAVTVSYLVCTLIDKLRVKIFKQHPVNFVDNIYNKIYAKVIKFI